MRRGTFQLMKSVNKSLVLNKIRTSEPTSRAQIAKETKLTPPTVSSIVKELIEEELVVESDLGESQGGRKPTMLLINHNAFYIIGVDAGARSIKCFAGNLSGEVIARAEPKTITKPISKEEFMEKMIDIIQSVLNSLSDPNKVLGIGVAMHGVVDVDRGISLVASDLNFHDMPIKDELESTFNMIVQVENDVRAMALGESWFNVGGNAESMLAVNLGARGVGAGLVIDGKLYHGVANLAGEVGHMTIDLSGDLCDCGSRGCFQTFATGDAIAKRARETLAIPDDSDAGELTSEQIYQKAIAGNEALAGMLKETGEIIGIALTNLIHVINPGRIVLGGGVSKAESLILPVVKETIKQRGLTPEAKQTSVGITTFGDDATLMGALSLLLVELFEGNVIGADVEIPS